MLTGCLACMLWVVILLLVVVSTMRSGFEWEMYALLHLCVSAKAVIICITFSKSQIKMGQ